MDTSSIKVGRHLRWRPTALGLHVSVTVMVAAVVASTMAACTSPRAPHTTTPAASSAEVVHLAVLDLVQPGTPFPIVLDANPSPSAGPLAAAVIAADELGVPIDRDPGRERVLAGYLDALSTDDHGGQLLGEVWLVLRAMSPEGRSSAATRRAVRAYLGRLDLVKDRTDQSILLKTAYAARIGRLGGDDPAWSEVSAAASTVASRSFAKGCPAITTVLAENGLAVRGLAVEASTGVTQSCVTVAVDDLRGASTNALGATGPTGAADAGAIEEIAALVTAGRLTVTDDERTRMRDMAAGDLATAASALAKQPSLACPTDIIRHTADLVAATGLRVEVPDVVAGCLSRAVRWRGTLPDLDSAPSAMSTVLAYRAAHVAGGSAGTDVFGAIDWASPDLTDTDRLILALAFDRSKLSPDLIDRVARADIGRATLGVMLLNAASAAVGQCPSAAHDRTVDWLTAAAGPEQQGVGTVWSVFAVDAARTCIGDAATAADRDRLAAVRAGVGRTLAALTPTAAARERMTVAWLRTAARCMDVPAGEPPLTGTESATLEPAVFGDLVDAGAVAPLDLLIYAQMLRYPQVPCGEFAWLTGGSPAG
jgi:hypothetical protein